MAKGVKVDTRGKVGLVMSEETYCEVCLENFTDDNDFNHRFDYPVCLSCADKMVVLV